MTPETGFEMNSSQPFFAKKGKRRPNAALSLLLG
jgi:hypothetical protein